MVLKAVDKFIYNVGRPNLIRGEFVDLNIKKKDEDFYTLQFSKSVFDLEKSYRSQLSNRPIGLNKPMGYLKYKENLLVIQGDIDDFFDSIKSSEINNIFYRKKEEGILPIYEPAVYEYELLKGNLKFIGTD